MFPLVAGTSEGILKDAADNPLLCGPGVSPIPGDVGRVGVREDPRPAGSEHSP